MREYAHQRFFVALLLRTASQSSSYLSFWHYNLRMITQIPFGRTGHNSTRTLFGAAALGKVTQSEADATLDVLLEYGVNHIDTAASYGDSELRIGPWMRRHRSNFFLATKTGDRTYAAARESIHRSLERLQTDHLDLIQLHYLVKPDEWEIAMGDDGALRACVEAREQKLVRFIGVTGHDVAIAGMHQRSLARYHFDSVLLPYNYLMMQNPEYAMGFAEVVRLCRERDVAVQTIKSLVRRRWGDGARGDAPTWYEPLREQGDIDLAVAYVLSKPGIFLNTVGDIHLLPRVLSAAKRFCEGDLSAPTPAQMRTLVGAQQMSPMFW
jgi:aryl-alcohol dehydrogenase-like predicted oxidoreductase